MTFLKKFAPLNSQSLRTNLRANHSRFVNRELNESESATYFFLRYQNFTDLRKCLIMKSLKFI